MTKIIQNWERTGGSGIYTVTPADARSILSDHAHPGNRTLRQLHLRNLMMAMRNGSWRVTHQGLAFAADGTLLDGHHRLHACIEAGVPFQTWIVFDLSPNAFEAIDFAGATRTVKDVMTMRSVAAGGERLNGALIDPLSYLGALLTQRRRKASLAQVEHIYKVLKPEVNDVAIRTYRKVAGRTAASLKAAVLIRLAGLRSNPQQRQYLLDQWRAFVELDFPAMDLTIQASVRRMDGMIGRNWVMIDERAAIGWIGFGPDRDLTRILIASQERCLQRLREATRAVVGEISHIGQRSD